MDITVREGRLGDADFIAWLMPVIPMMIMMAF